MHDSDETAVPESDPGLCDLCGGFIPSDLQIFSLVPDSSVIHPDDPGQDGQRLLAACSPEHLAELQQQYRQRPYVNEELWSGKIARALRAHPEGLDEEQLVHATGLNFIQIEHTLSWESERFLCHQIGEGEDEGHPDAQPDARPDAQPDAFPSGRPDGHGEDRTGPDDGAGGGWREGGYGGGDGGGP
ncbi:hypothetical protein ACFCVY_09905 [Streptomyces sp. NPDC056411]|uniref:hypothetical protein n=1 Tax=Streptomyces sp. NPDC056411 TaxID=3345813 RepID=UPI0035D691F3